MKKLLLVIGLLIISLAGCGFIDLNLNESVNGTTNTTAVSNMTSPSIIEGVSEENETEPVEPVTPIVDHSNLPTKNIKEGETIEFKQDLAYDPDGDTLSYSFSAPLNKEGAWETKLGDAGEYIVTVTVTDGKLNSNQQIKLIVEAINKLPQILNFENIKIKEGNTIKLNPQFSDEDGDSVTYSLEGFMTTTSKKTDFNDAGIYSTTLTANDGKQPVTKTIEIEIENVNRAPSIDKLETISIIEGETTTVALEVSDPDGDALNVIFGKPLNENGSWATAKGDAGKYDVEISVSDGDITTTETIEVLIKSLNNAPTLEVAKDIIVEEGEIINLNPKFNDQDGDSLTVTYSGFMTSSTYQTTFEDSGAYETTISVSDGEDTIETMISITIEETNRAPIFNSEWFE